MKRIETQRWRALEGALFTLQPVALQPVALQPVAPQPVALQPATGGPAREDWSVTVRLDGVLDLGARGAPGEPLPCYSLLFSQQAPAGGHAPQGLYRLNHPELGSQELFVVPLGPSPKARMTYEVVLN